MMIEYDISDSWLLIAYFANSMAVYADPVRTSDLLTKPDHPLTEEVLADMTGFVTELLSGQVTKLVRGVEGYELAIAGIEDVFHVISLNRSFLPTQIIKDILMRLRCPADLHLYSDDFGGNEI